MLAFFCLIGSALAISLSDPGLGRLDELNDRVIVALPSLFDSFSLEISVQVMLLALHDSSVTTPVVTCFLEKATLLANQSILVAQGETLSNWTIPANILGYTITSTKEFSRWDFKDLIQRDDAMRLVLKSSDPLSTIVADVVHTPLSGAGHYQAVFGGVLLVLVFVLIALDWVNATLVAFAGAIIGWFIVTGIRGAPSTETVFGWVDWSSITLLMMMMIINNLYATTGVFEWMSYKILIICKGRPVLLFLLLNAFGMIVSAFLPNVTAVLLISPVILQMAKGLDITPVPLFYGLIFFTTMGGCMTLIGDPPNLIIGNNLNIDFVTFLVNLAPMVLIMFFPSALFMVWFYRKELTPGSAVHVPIPRNKSLAAMEMKKFPLDEPSSTEISPPSMTATPLPLIRAHPHPPRINRVVPAPSTVVSPVALRQIVLGMPAGVLTTPLGAAPAGPATVAPAVPLPVSNQSTSPAPEDPLVRAPPAQSPIPESSLPDVLFAAMSAPPTPEDLEPPPNNVASGSTALIVASTAASATASATATDTATGPAPTATSDPATVAPKATATTMTPATSSTADAVPAASDEKTVADLKDATSCKVVALVGAEPHQLRNKRALWVCSIVLLVMICWFVLGSFIPFNATWVRTRPSLLCARDCDCDWVGEPDGTRTELRGSWLCRCPPWGGCWFQVSIVGATVAMILASPKEVDENLAKVEWSALLFFAALFVLVAEVAQLRLLDLLAQVIIAAILALPDGARLPVAMLIIIWLSGILSAFINNIPYTVAMIPVISQMSADPVLHLPLKPLAWALVIGTALGGNGSLIGASSNVIVASFSTRAGYPMTFRAFLKIGLPFMVITLLIGTFYVLLVYCVIFP
ncbi:putative P protein [Paratrimastix pyriformis]|uniref:P protein n=1 Tax=Paratrimastix pyriformis TaxID=342808 RepID=A0ABQ8UV40_9EUKA|nr:putative P protein [Paratrimastix pyriformis]